jgi:hypothetical protein
MAFAHFNTSPAPRKTQNFQLNDERSTFNNMKRPSISPEYPKLI